MKYRKLKKQEVADKANEAAVDVYHLAEDLHKRACASQCPDSHDKTADFLIKAIELKKAGMALNGCIPETDEDTGAIDGGISVMSGST